MIPEGVSGKTLRIRVAICGGSGCGASDTTARNRHGAFVDGAPCPDAAALTIDDAQQLDFVAGMSAVESAGDGLGDDDDVCEAGERCHNRFVVHATEAIMDGIGDDDGLCESHETCIYAPNVGAYQGEGDYLTRSCVFQDGAVTDVTMHAYPINGG